MRTNWYIRAYLRRYLAQYKAEGFSGLKPKSKGRQSSEDAIPANILEQVIVLRREVPGRSRGYSSRHMCLYSDSGIAARRFQKKYRNQLWHSDIKYGPYLPIGKDGAKKGILSNIRG